MARRPQEDVRLECVEDEDLDVGEDRRGSAGGGWCVVGVSVSGYGAWDVSSREQE